MDRETNCRRSALTSWPPPPASPCGVSLARTGKGPLDQAIPMQERTVTDYEQILGHDHSHDHPTP
jgi:hypothetical protein